MRTFMLILFILSAFKVSGTDLSIMLKGDYYGDIEPSTEYNNLSVRLYAIPEISGDIIEKFLDYNLSVNIYIQPVGEYTVVQTENFFREGYLRFYGKIYNLYIGQRFMNWGKVDFYSPVNVINPLDTTVLSLDNIEESRLPVLMAEIMLKLGDSTSLDIIYEPFLRPYHYPDERLDIKVKFFTFDVDAAFYHEAVPYLSREAHSVFIAFNYWSYWFDLLFSYSYYMDTFPDFDLSGITQVTDSSGLLSVHTIRGEAGNTYNRAHLIGLGIGTNIEGWGIDIESGLKITRDWEGSKVEIKNSEAVSNIQVNKTFFNQFFCQFNFIYRYIFNHDVMLESDLKPLVLSYLESEMQKVFLQKAESTVYIVNHIHRYALHETLYTAINSGVGFPLNYKGEYELELYLAPRITYAVSDYIKLETGADIFIQGDQAGYIGRNKFRDNIYIRFIIDI